MNEFYLNRTNYSTVAPYLLFQSQVQKNELWSKNIIMIIIDIFIADQYYIF